MRTTLVTGAMLFVLSLTAACGDGSAGQNTPSPVGVTRTATVRPTAPAPDATRPPASPAPATETAPPCGIRTGCVSPEATGTQRAAATVVPCATGAPCLGRIAGRALAGPTCPVERLDSPCPDRPVEVDITVLDASGAAVAHLRSDVGGRFTAELPPGDYVVRGQSGANGFPRAGADVAAQVRAGVTTEVVVSFDTGIR